MSLIRVENLTFAYEGAYDNIFENASFTIDTDWKLGLVGRNGRGKTTFLRLLMANTYRGSIVTDARFEYFPFEWPTPKSDRACDRKRLPGAATGRFGRAFAA